MEIRRATKVANTPWSKRLRMGATAGSRWWKVWVLLASLVATVLGWMALTGDEATDRAVARSNVQVSAPVAPVSAVGTLDVPQRLERSAHTLPSMPQKPVFQAPVTRTRRS